MWKDRREREETEKRRQGKRREGNVCVCVEGREREGDRDERCV
jgi:hypothetical protein